MDETGLRLDDLAIQQGTTPLLELSAHIAPGEILTVMGPSGSGKSTLLSCIIGLLAPDFRWSGQIHLNGAPIGHLPPQQRRVGILFQDHLLFPHMSVGENLAFGLPAAIKGRRERIARIDAALEDIGLGGFANRDPATLSGGQKARVALMRTLLSDPKALLLDEPFSRLDADRRAQIRELVFQHAQDRALPVLLVTHDKDDATAAGGETVILG